MATERQSRPLKWRAILLSAALMGLVGFALIIGYAPHLELLSLVVGLFTLLVCGLYVFNFVRIDSPSTTPPGSLERLIRGYAGFLLVSVVVAVIGFSIEYELSGLMDYVAIIGYAVISIGFLGSIAFVFIVLPIWYVGSKFKGHRD